MDSVFLPIDCRCNASSEFWQVIQTVLADNIVSSAIFGGNLKTCTRKGMKSKRFILTTSKLYLLSKWKIPKLFVDINWKCVEPFVEKKGDLFIYGFRLTGHNHADFYTASSADLDRWLEKLSKVCILTSFEEDFINLQELSVLSENKIIICKHASSHTDFAVKVLKKSTFTSQPGAFHNAINEISILRQLDHPHIVQLYRVYETRSEILLVFEYLPAGDMLSRCSKVSSFTESDTMHFMRLLFKALHYLHSAGIAHRDIKFQNIAFFSDQLEDFKIIDFGLACRYENGMSSKCGTPGWIAPEVLRGDLYDCKVDMFSAGVLMYTMLTGRMLFYGKTAKDVLKKNAEAVVNFIGSEIKGMDSKTITLLRVLLSPNPNTRISSMEAIKIGSENDEEKGRIEKKSTSDSAYFSSKLRKL
jgi:hypothetical protein